MKRRKSRWKDKPWLTVRRYAPLALLLLLLSACGGQDTRSQVDYFTPPTLVPQSSPVVSATPTEAPTPTELPKCINSLKFIEDVTIPDGTVFPPGARMDKQWRVENNGTCNWGARYQVQLIAGPEMGANQEQALFPARSGSEAVISIIFIAPEEPGGYRSSWQAHDPDGNPFGEPFFIDIVVDSSLPDE